MTAARRLADATTMRVGGDVERWIEATTRDEVAAAYGEILERDDEHLLLGGGSNTVASDEPYDGDPAHSGDSVVRGTLA